MNWTGSLSWGDEESRQRRQSGKPPNRRLVEVIVCPTCHGLTDLRCHRRTTVKSYWTCTAGKGCPDWTEPPTAGETGRAHIA